MIRQIYPLPAFTDNYIWTVLPQEGSGACVVDPGDAGPVMEYLEKHALNLDCILLTHHHPDHVGGLPALIERYQPVIYGPGGSGIKGITKLMSEGSSLELYGETFRVMEVPGHTLDHIAYFCPNPKDMSPILFCGDTLFAAGCGRLFEGTAEQMFDSLSKLRDLPPQTQVFCTHEYTLANLRFASAVDPDNPALINRIQSEQDKRDNDLPTLPSSIGLELATNPFLRWQDRAIKANAESNAQRKMSSEVEVFAAIRSWKDNF